MTTSATTSSRSVPRLSPRPGLTRPGSWADRALCAQADPDAFFPDHEDDDQAAAAIEVCTRCPVRTACLAHALAIREPDGIWGGATPAQRRALLAGRKAA